jgi:putative transposase
LTKLIGWPQIMAICTASAQILSSIKRLMREHSLQPRRRRRHVATTDSDHDLAMRTIIASS